MVLQVGEFCSANHPTLLISDDSLPSEWSPLWRTSCRTYFPLSTVTEEYSKRQKNLMFRSPVKIQWSVLFVLRLCILAGASENGSPAELEQHSLVHTSGSLTCRLASVHLVDSFLCSNANQYISALLLSLNIMMSLELPHINILSKIDLVESQGELAFNLEYYSEVHLSRFLESHLGSYFLKESFLP